MFDQSGYIVALTTYHIGLKGAVSSLNYLGFGNETFKKNNFLSLDFSFYPHCNRLLVEIILVRKTI